MTTITTRSGKGSPLTNDEVDANFTNLNDDKVEASGDSMTGNLSFGDNNKAIFGAGSDFEIFHDGGSGYSQIKETGPAGLLIRSNDLRLQSSTGENGLIVSEDGAVTAYYDNAAKLATTSTGIDVTGNVVSDGLTVDGTANLNSAVTITSTSAALFFMESDTTDLNTRLRNNGGNFAIHTVDDSKVTVGLRFAISNSTGDITFYDTDGSTASFVYDADAGLTINEAGADRDFRVESDSNTHALFVEGDNTNNRIKLGMGTGTITNPYGQDNFTDLNINGTWGGVISFKLNGTEYGWIGQRNSGNGDMIVGASSGQSLFLASNGNTSRIELTDAGNVVVNPTGADSDFRVESDSNSHMLFVNAGLDQVAIGSGTITAPSGYHLFSYGSGSGARSAFVHGAGDGGIVVSGAAGGSAASVIFGNNWGTNGATFSEEWRLFMDGADDSLKFKYAANTATAMSLSSGGTMTYNFAAIFNESGGDNDFRVESDSNANMLYVDAGNNRVGIGKVPLTTSLDVSTSMNIEGDASPSGNGLALGDYGTTGSYKWIQSFNSQPLRLNPLGNEVSIGISGVGANFKTFGNTVINEDGGDNDFRVESNGNTHTLFVDGGADKVSIGSSSSDTRFNVYNNTNASAGIHVENLDTGTGARTMLDLRSDGGNFFMYATGSNYNGVTSWTDSGVLSTSTSLSGGIKINSQAGGIQLQDGTVNRFQIKSSGEIVANEDGQDRDFRVESDSNANMLFVDAGNDRVGINQSSPAESFHVTSISDGRSAAMFDPNVISSGAGASAVTMQIRGQKAACLQVDRYYSHGVIMAIKQNGSTVGSISVTGSTTAYNTSSDARLKENIADAEDAGALIDAIQVRQFDWIADGEHQRYGMVAQELNTVAPEAVSEGETEEDMMAVDYSKLVPMLVKEIQSLRARVAQLESN